MLLENAIIIFLTKTNNFFNQPSRHDLATTHVHAFMYYIKFDCDGFKNSNNNASTQCHVLDFTTELYCAYTYFLFSHWNDYRITGGLVVLSDSGD